MNTTSPATAYDRWLLQLGALLFLIGLLTGFLVPVLALPRIGLSGHLQGVMNGLVLMVLGLIWPRLRLGAWAQFWTFALAVYGAFANWGATLIAAATGAVGLMPVTGGSVSTGGAVAEAVVGFLLISLSVAMIGAFALVLWGLRRP